MSDTGTHTRGELLVALSNRIVAIYKELYGKGPVKVRTWYLDDLVLCVCRGGLTRGELTFVEIGRGDRVALQRGAFHEAVSPVFAQAVEEIIGRQVETTLHSTDDQSDVSTLVFLLQSPEAAALQETDEGLARERKQMRKKAAEVREASRALHD
ncbi:MAG: Na-translocating system protein MpsC family protein [Thermoleophilaceae bacterium]